MSEVRTLGDLESLPLEVFCKFFSGRNNWSELKQLIYKLPQIQERLYACVEEIDFADGFPLIGFDYDLLNQAPVLTPKLINNVLQRFSHLKKYYVDVESREVTNEVLDLIQDVRGQELVIRLESEIDIGFVENLAQGLIKRLRKYGTNFTLVVRSNYRGGFLFKYIKGVVRIPRYKDFRKKIIDVMYEFPELFEAGLGKFYDAPIRTLLTGRYIDRFPDRVNQVVYILDQPYRDRIDHFQLANYIPIQSNITSFIYPIDLEEDQNYDVTTDWTVNQFKEIFPNAKKIYPVEYFLIKQESSDKNPEVWDRLRAYQAAYGDIIAIPGKD